MNDKCECNVEPPVLAKSQYKNVQRDVGEKEKEKRKERNKRND